MLPYIYIYIYMCVCCSINKWSTFWVVQQGPHFRVNMRCTSETTIKIVVPEDVCKQCFQEGAQSVCRFLVFWFKTGFSRKGMVAIPFFNFSLWWLLVDVSTRL